VPIGTTLFKKGDNMSVFYVHTKDIIPVINGAGTNKNVEYDGEFNYNTYLKLTPLFKALIISSNAGGKYDLKIGDLKKGFYFIYAEGNLSIKVPLSAIFNTNDKIKGILGIAFSTARDCPSNKRGLCQLPDGELCYALKGEKQGTKKAPNYLMGMDSLKNTLLSIYYWELFKKDPATRFKFLDYLTFYNIDYLRFNLKGDFKSLGDILIINYLANNGGTLKLTGYTARDDLYKSLFELIDNNPNVILNGSNIKYSNHFRATDLLADYILANYPCRGGCLKNNCLNCYKLKGVIITCLIHGSGSDTQLNNKYNRELLNTWFKTTYNLDITGAWGSNLKGLVSSLNKYLLVNNLFESLKVPEALRGYTKKGKLKGFKNAVALCNFIKANGGI